MDISGFIKKPVLSIVLSILVSLVGILGYMSLPVEQYPDIAPPTINVYTTYFGANAETIIKAVITPLEESINGVENMIYMSSTAANNGTASIDVVFKQGTDPDVASVLVQNRVSSALAQLPTEVKNVGVTTEKKQNSMLQIINVWSPDDRFNSEWLTNFAIINIKPKLLRITGIGKFDVLSATYSMRIWMDPMKLQQYSLAPQDIISAVASQNFESGTGTIGENSDESYQYTMKYSGRFKTVEEFENIVLRATSDGSVLRLKEVATVSLGIENYNMQGNMDGHPGSMAIVYQAPGSNAQKVNQQIDALLDEVRQNDLPSGVEISQLLNTNEFLDASTNEVYKTLIEAIILVIIIVLVFLQDLRSTFIPFVGILVSLIGTFAFMLVMGFSINLITLFALVLVIGTVVDDSIIVVEAVHAKFDKGIKSPLKATQSALGEITGAVITSSLVFMAVFVPVSFLGGTSGEFYKEFGLSMAFAVGISAFNALTTVPALCAIMLKPKKTEGSSLTARYIRWFDSSFEKMSSKYAGGIRHFLKAPVVSWGIIIGSIFLLGYFMTSMKTGLVPEEDQRILICEVGTAPGSSLNTTADVTRQVYEAIKDFPEVEHISYVTGYGFVSGASSTAAAVIVRLKHWDERDGLEHSQWGVQRKIVMATQGINDALFVFPFGLPMIPGYGTSSAVDLHVMDRMGGSVQDLLNVTKDFVDKLNARPEIAGGALYTFKLDNPQWQVDVDVPACISAGTDPNTVLQTVAANFGGSYISDINLFNKVYKVMLQAGPEYRTDESALDRMFVKLSNGKMSPLSNFVTLTRVYGSESLRRFNMCNEINVSVNPAPTSSSGDVVKAIRECAKEYLPTEYTVDFGGMAREQSDGAGLIGVLLLCMFIIYLILSALYESFIIPFSVLLSVPFGLMMSYLASYLFGMENNIYLQTGVIMLIGLISKTGILITEFAVQKHEQGMDIVSSAIAAAEARLRPILMTVLTMVFGLFPMVAATGVGANGSRALGLGTVVGMTFGAIGLLLFVPVLYVFFQTLQDKFSAGKHNEDDEEIVATINSEEK